MQTGFRPLFRRISGVWDFEFVTARVVSVDIVDLSAPLIDQILGQSFDIDLLIRIFVDSHHTPAQFRGIQVLHSNGHVVNYLK